VAEIGDGWVATQILVVSDAARSRDWWTQVIGAEEFPGIRRHKRGAAVRQHVGVAVTGGEPTPDKPSVAMALVGPTRYFDHQRAIDDTVPHGWH
jgi:hypothetical protein